MARIMGRRTLARALGNLEEKIKPEPKAEDRPKAERPKAEKKAPTKKTSGSK